MLDSKHTAPTFTRVLALFSLALLASTGLAFSQTPGLDEAKQTMSSLRTVGTALAAFHADLPKEPTGSDEVIWPTSQPLPIASWDDLEQALVPDIIPHLNRVDGWGTELEVRVNPKLWQGRQVASGEPAFAILSAGADHEFEDGEYPLGCFDFGQHPDHDITWTDGYFASYPAPQGSEDCSADGTLKLR